MQKTKKKLKALKKVFEGMRRDVDYISNDLIKTKKELKALKKDVDKMSNELLTVDVDLANHKDKLIELDEKLEVAERYFQGKITAIENELHIKLNDSLVAKINKFNSLQNTSQIYCKEDIEPEYVKIVNENFNEIL